MELVEWIGFVIIRLVNRRRCSTTVVMDNP